MSTTVGRCWLYDACDPAWHAFAFWDAPSEADVAEIVALFTAVQGGETPHAVLADVRHLQDVVRPAFARLGAYVVEHRSTLGALITSACILHSSALVGAVASGFFHVVPSPFPVTASSDAAVARARLGASAESWAAYEVTLAAARDAGGFRRSLGAALQQEQPTLARVAKRLAMAPRSLQRRLQALGTTLPRERERVRLERAQALLSSTSLAIGEIAYELGFASPEQLATAFRAATGETPTAYRARTTGAKS